MSVIRSILNSEVVLRIAEVIDRRSENRITEFGMLAQAFEFTKINAVQGDYFEFGVWQGKTFCYARTMVRRYRLKDVRFRAFDSFQGLPAAENGKYEIWRQGQFAFSRSEFERVLRRSGFRADEYAITEGFYAESLNGDLIDELNRMNVRAAVVYVDCDLYESTRDVLKFIVNFLQDGSVLCFDDYWNYRGRSDMGEQRAIAEFLAAHPDLSLRPFMPYSPLGMSFVCELRDPADT